MLDEITSLLRDSGADDWTVADEKKYGWQFYFIRHRLDQNRVVNTEHVTVTVFKKSEDGAFLGSASEEIPPTATAEEAGAAIGDLLERAAYVRNPVYALRKPSGQEAQDGNGAARKEETDAALLTAREDQTENRTGTAAAGSDAQEIVSAVSCDFIDTMNHLPETATEDVNSYEIFVNEIERRFVTSTGIDQTQHYPSSMLEVVTNARNEAYLKTRRAGDGAEEIELYRMYLSGTCDAAALSNNISRTLQYGKDRLRTVPTPALGQIPVVFSTADSVTIYQYFVSQLNAQLIYQKISRWQVGKPIVEKVEGDRLTISAVKYLPNSSQNYAFDSEGAPIRDEVLIRENVAEHIWGSAMFSDYLGLKDTFQVSNFAVRGGSLSEAQIRSGRYLEIVEFSDFQVDAMTGAVFGEIRLGYLHEEDGSVKCVSGGSVSGSMLDYMKRMYFSSETVQYDNAVVPSLTKLMDVTVTGAASGDREGTG